MTDQQLVTEPIGMSDVEAEHALQYKLLDEAERLLQMGDVGKAREVVGQLYHYSEAHFGSEQVIMRLHSYPGYQAHQREHGDLLAALTNLLANVESEHGSTTASALRRWLTAHIQHADQALVDFMRSQPSTSR